MFAAPFRSRHAQAKKYPDQYHEDERGKREQDEEVQVFHDILPIPLPAGNASKQTLFHSSCVCEMIGRGEIEAAAFAIADEVRRTPVFFLPGEKACELKLEQMQLTGSFKARGAFTHLLTCEIPRAGVAAASGGNHGLAVATAATRLGHKATIFVPTVAGPAKVDAIRATGAVVTIGGERYADALEACKAFVGETGALAIHAYDADATIAGQGTIAAEWEGQTDGIDTVLVAVGGGGLIAGIAAWFADRVRVIGVEPVGANALTAALLAGRPVDVEIDSIAADSLGAKRVGARNYAIAHQYVARTALVTDEAIVAAQRALWKSARILAEPGGATAYAALSSGAYRPADGERVGVLVCGANIDPATWGAGLMDQSA